MKINMVLICLLSISATTVFADEIRSKSVDLVDGMVPAQDRSTVAGFIGRYSGRLSINDDKNPEDLTLLLEVKDDRPTITILDPAGRPWQFHGDFGKACTFSDLAARTIDESWTIDALGRPNKLLMTSVDINFGFAGDTPCLDAGLNGLDVQFFSTTGMRVASITMPLRGFDYGPEKGCSGDVCQHEYIRPRFLMGDFQAQK